MAVGDLIGNEYEFETAGGYLFGGSHDVQLVSVDGLAALPGIRSSDFVLLRTDGLSPGDDFYGGRTVSVTVDIVAVEDPQAVRRFIEETTPQPLAAETYTAFWLPTVCDDNVGLFKGRLRRRSGLVDLPWSYGVSVLTVEWDCTDPRLYSAALNTTSGVALAGVTGGLTWPLTWPLDWGGAQTGQTTVTNAGTFPAPVEFTINGPVTAPRIENLTSGKTISSTMTLASGESLVIDTGARTVLFGGVTRSGTLTSSSQWFDLAPGDNTIRMTASSGTGTLDIEWRDTWI